MANTLTMARSKKQKKKKQLTDHDKEIIMYSSPTMIKDIDWLYKEVIAKRDKVNSNLVEEVEEEILKRSDSNENRFFTLKDICKLLDWQFPRDKEKRNKLSNISSVLFMTIANPQSLLYNFVKRSITEDVDNPSDLFLTKKQQKSAKKRRRLEKKHGVDTIKIPKNDTDKRSARKERARLRKEAKKLGMSLAEYKDKNNL